MNKSNIEKYFFFGLLLLVAVFSVFIFKPFLSVLVIGISFTVVLYPLHQWFMKHITKYSGLSALLCVIFFIIVVCGPLFFIGKMVFNESESLYRSFSNPESQATFIESASRSFEAVLPNGLPFSVKDKLGDATSFIFQHLSDIFSATLSTLFMFMLVVITMFYFLKDGVEWRKMFLMLNPFSNHEDETILHRLTVAINGVIKGSLFILVIQGILMGVGLYIFGVPNPALWGVFAGVMSLVPTLGTAIVSVPAFLFLLGMGATGPAIGFAIWAIVVVGMVDNFLTPLIVGSKINVPPIFILFAVLGGIVLLGPVGILIGPLTISLLFTLIDIYKKQYASNQ